jgi:hypothetical protein
MKRIKDGLKRLSTKTREAPPWCDVMVMGLALSLASVSFAKDDTELNNLPQLVLQWKKAIATGELSELLAVYAESDQDKVAKVFPWVKTGQVQLPFVAELVDGRWVMRGDELQLPPTAQAAVVNQPIDGSLALAIPATPAVVPVQVEVDTALAQPSASAVQQQIQNATQLPLQTYAVSLADQNFRKVLKRWTNASGWMFEPEHWGVHRDIPVSGNDAVMTDFKTAVRRLLKSTLLTELPVQPCFYSNKVLRVIPVSELCARTEN